VLTLITEREGERSSH